MRNPEKMLKPEHLNLIEDLDVIRLKQEAMSGIQAIFDSLIPDLEAILDSYKNKLVFHLPKQHAKISRGENYRSLPYQILDYPRSFHLEDVFAFRTMFLWGNFFSFSFQLSGKYLEAGRYLLEERLQNLKGGDYHFCVNSSPWEYTYDDENYKMLDQLLLNTSGKALLERPFIKISRKIDLRHWMDVKSHATETLTSCLELLLKV
jgi:hypothetical protein